MVSDPSFLDSAELTSERSSSESPLDQARFLHHQLYSRPQHVQMRKSRCKATVERSRERRWWRFVRGCAKLLLDDFCVIGS